MEKYICSTILTYVVHIINTCFRTQNIVSKYTKTQIEDKEKENLVYQFRCNCGERTYTSETELTLTASMDFHII